MVETAIRPTELQKMAAELELIEKICRSTRGTNAD